MAIVRNLADFSQLVNDGLAQVDWLKKRDIIRALVKRVEIGKEAINVVFKLTPVLGDSSSKENNFESLQRCCGSQY